MNESIRSDAAQASPQFWESAPTTKPNRVYFTSEADGRVIAGGSGTGATLTREEAVSLAAWLLRQTDVEREAHPRNPLADPETMDRVMRSTGLQ